MWIFTNSGFISVVADRNSTGNLLVRARVRGHIQAMFPCADVFTDEHADYYYRALLPRKTVADAMAQSVEAIAYPNFKNSVSDPALHASYVSVWWSMRNLQDKQLGRTDD